MQECKIAISKAQMQRCRRACKSATLQKQHKDAKEACKNANLKKKKQSIDAKEYARMQSYKSSVKMQICRNSVQGRKPAKSKVRMQNSTKNATLQEHCKDAKEACENTKEQKGRKGGMQKLMQACTTCRTPSPPLPIFLSPLPLPAAHRGSKSASVLSDSGARMSLSRMLTTSANLGRRLRSCCQHCIISW